MCLFAELAGFYKYHIVFGFITSTAKRKNSKAVLNFSGRILETKLGLGLFSTVYLYMFQSPHDCLMNGPDFIVVQMGCN